LIFNITISISIFILLIFTIFLCRYTFNNPNLSTLFSDISQIILATLAVFALCISIVGYRAAVAIYEGTKDIEINKATIEARTRLLDKINENTRAAISLIDVSDEVLSAVVRSTKISGEKLDARKNHYGRLLTGNAIEARDVNLLRFALVQELNEYESFVRSLNLEIIKCEHVVDVVLEVAGSSFNPMEKFAREYDKLHPIYRDRSRNSWGTVMKLRETVKAIMKDQTAVHPAEFCALYKKQRLQENSQISFAINLGPRLKTWSAVLKSR
jgi:hypothetical protein